MPIINLPLQLSRKDLAKRFGGQSNRAFSNALSFKTQFWETQLPRLVEPRLFYTFHQVTGSYKDGVKLKGNIRLKSNKLARALRQCKEIVSFLATLGSQIDNEIRRLVDLKQMSEAFILDSMGSVAVENLVDRFHWRVRKQYDLCNQTVSLCFSPGYCDWPITDQKKLFKLIDAAKVGVELTNSCLMRPRKSISGIFGVYDKHIDETKRYNPCKDCRKGNCTHRRY